MAVSLDDLAGKGRTAGRAARTLSPDEIPEQKAPPGKKLPEPKPVDAAGRAEEDAPPALLVKAGTDVGKSYPVTRPLSLVGRGLDADIVINDQSASRKHFNIVKTQSGWKLVDVGSGNGTKVDGVKVPEIALKHGMIIELGSTKLEWRAGGTAAGDANGKADPSRGSAARGGPSRSAEPEDAPERTQFADISGMAALELDPEFEKRKAAARKDVDSARANSDAETDAPEPEASGTGRKIGIGLAVVALLGGAFVAVDKFAGLGVIFPAASKRSSEGDERSSEADKPGSAEPGAAADAEKKAAAEASKEKARKEATAKVEEGRVALEAGKVFAAAQAFQAALDLDDEAEGASEGDDKASKALKRLGAAVKLQKALATGDFAEAGALVADALATGLPSKAWTEKAGPFVTAVATADLVGAAAGLLEAGKPDDAKKLVEAALKVSPDNEQVKLLNAAVEAAASPSADLRFVPEGEPKPDDKVAATSMTPAFDAYLKALKSDDKILLDLHGKIQNAGLASVRDVKKSQAYESATGCAITGSATADGHVKAAAFDKALPELLAARICDAMLASKRAAALDAATATTANSLAKAMAASDPGLSAALLKLALALQPGLAEAKTSLDALAPKAAEALDKARAAKDDPDAALAEALIAMSFGAVDSPVWKDAASIVDGLLKK